MVKHSLVKNGSVFNVIATIDAKELAQRVAEATAQVKAIDEKVTQINAQIDEAVDIIKALKLERDYHEWFLNSANRAVVKR